MIQITKKQDEILSAIGLKKRMQWLSSNTRIYDERKFISYVAKLYVGSEQQEMDEIYRMSELNLIHVNTGIRVSYLTSESYDGEEVDYILKNIFVLTNSGEALKLLDVDFEKKIYITPSKQFEYSEINVKVD